MITIKEKAAAPTATHKKIVQRNGSYPQGQTPSTENHRAERIRKRRAQIPRAYRAKYNKAVKGNSLRAAIDAQCLECISWHIEDIRNCTDLACPLYAVRPYQSSQSGRESRDTSAGATLAGSLIVKGSIIRILTKKMIIRS